MAYRLLAKAILLGGLLGGALDLLFAVTFATLNGATPSQVLQAIASGALGRSAGAGGTEVEALGLFLHFALSIAWAAVFAGAAWRWPGLVRRRLLSTTVFGVAVFLCMRLVVLPLSAYPRPVTFKPLATALDLLSHILLFGGPIVLVVARAIGSRRSNNSSKPAPLRSAA